MKTAILTTTFHAHQGADRVMWQLADKLARQGDVVTIFTFSGTMDPPPGVRLVDMGMPRGFTGQRLFHLLFPLNISKGLKYSALLKGFDRIYTGPYPASWLAYLAKRRYNIPYTYYFHHFNFPGFVPGLGARIYTHLHILGENWTLKNANRIITVSNYSRDSLRGLFQGPIEVVYNTVDCSKFHPNLQGANIRTKHGLSDEPLILCVGQLIPSKGMHLLIQTFKEVRNQLPDAKLLIIGKPVYPGYMDKLRKMSDGSVIFVSDVEDEEMPLYYAACDVYATATLWEGFNIPLVEAQACGKPVVAFNIGPHPEVVIINQTGILVKEINVRAMSGAIIKLLSDKELNIDMGKKGRQFIQGHFCSGIRLS